jgi:hypothetical protein
MLFAIRWPPIFSLDSTRQAGILALDLNEC